MSQWFRGFRLKMLSLSGVSAAIVLLLSAFSIWQLNRATDKIEFLNTVRIPTSRNWFQISWFWSKVVAVIQLLSKLRHSLQSRVQSHNMLKKEM